jgi:hypothetical protein
MKKKRIKKLTINKFIISKFDQQEALKGGTGASETSCLCKDTMCDCVLEVPL